MVLMAFWKSTVNYLYVNPPGVFIAGIIAGMMGLFVILTVVFSLIVAAYKHRKCGPRYHRLDPHFGDMRPSQSTP